MKIIEIVDDNSIKTSELYEKIEENGNAWSYWSKDELDKEFPQPSKTTKRYFKVQKDPDILGKSANQMKDMNIMTLREYMIFYLKFKKETGEYPDEKGWTITSSRTSGGEVAYASRCGSGFGAYWSRGDDAGPRGGGREVVSLESSPLVDLTLESRLKALEDWKERVSKLLS